MKTKTIDAIRSCNEKTDVISDTKHVFGKVWLKWDKIQFVWTHYLVSFSKTTTVSSSVNGRIVWTEDCLKCWLNASLPSIVEWKACESCVCWCVWCKSCADDYRLSAWVECWRYWVKGRQSLQCINGFVVKKVLKTSSNAVMSVNCL